MRWSTRRSRAVLVGLDGSRRVRGRCVGDPHAEAGTRRRIGDSVRRRPGHARRRRRPCSRPGNADFTDRRGGRRSEAVRGEVIQHCAIDDHVVVPIDGAGVVLGCVEGHTPAVDVDQPPTTVPSGSVTATVAQSIASATVVSTCSPRGTASFPSNERTTSCVPSCTSTDRTRPGSARCPWPLGRRRCRARGRERRRGRCRQCGLRIDECDRRRRVGLPAQVADRHH